MRSKRRCRACDRAVRGAGVFLFETPKGPAYVCNQRCLAAYNCGGKGESCDCGMHGGVARPRRRRARAAA